MMIDSEPGARTKAAALADVTKVGTAAVVAGVDGVSATGVAGVEGVSATGVEPPLGVEPLPADGVLVTPLKISFHKEPDAFIPYIDPKPNTSPVVA